MNAPDCNMDDEAVETAEFIYSDRAPTDFVISGPLGDTNGRGRWFENMTLAVRYYRMKFGARFRGIIKEAEEFGGRYAFLITKPTKEIK